MNDLKTAMDKKIIAQQRNSLNLREKEILALKEENLKLRRIVFKLFCLIGELNDITEDMNNNSRRLLDDL